MDYERHLQTIKDGWGLVFAAILVFLLGAAGVAAMIQPKYVAKAALVVEPQRVDPFTGIALPAPLFSHLPTQVDIIRSERVALQVVDSTGLRNDARWQEKWQAATGGQGSFPAWLASRILQPLEVKPTRESNVLVVSYADTDAARAARMANAFVRAYATTALELRQEPAREWGTYFDETSRRLRANLDQAQNKLSRFQKENGIVSVDERLDVENARLTQLSAQLVTLQGASANASGRLRQARSGGVATADVQRDRVVAELNTDLARQESRLSELRSRLGEAHPSVVEQRDGVENLRQRLAAETRRAVAVIQNETRVASEEVATVGAALEAQRSKVLALNSLRDQARVLQREVDNAQRAFEAVLSRSNQKALEGGGSAGNVSVLNEATVPSMPGWKRRAIILGAGAGAGLLVGVALALWRERREPRLRTITDVQQLLDQRLLLTLPSQT